MEAYKASVLNPVAPGRAEFKSYLVVEDGKVVEATDNKPDCDVMGLEGKAIIPGMVDVHTHLCQFKVMGAGEGELLPWLKSHVFPEEAKFSDRRYAASVAREFFREMVVNGTTSASVYSSVHKEACDEAFNAAKEVGVRAFIGKVMMDRNVPDAIIEDASESVEASIRLCERWDNKGRLRYVFTPRFAVSCSEKLLSDVGEAASEMKAYVQTHLSENKAEIEAVRNTFGKGYVNVYKDAGILGKRSIMAHCIHLSEGEAKHLASTGTRVAHCPYSNTFLHSGAMPYLKWKSLGLTVGLGTDVAASPSLSMFEQMREAIKVSSSLGKTIGVEEAFYLATKGGADVLGLDAGCFAAGKEADFVVLDAGLFGAKDSLGLLKQIVEKGSKDIVNSVYVGGKRI